MDWDTFLFHAVNGWAGQSTALDWLMVQCSRSHNFIAAAVGYLAYRVWIDWRQGVLAASVLGALIGLGDFVGAQIKLWMARPRPCQVFGGINGLDQCGGTFSLPSNHALNTATASAFLWVLFPSTRWVVGAFMILGGLSRVYLGAHYPTDVVAGWSLGGTLGMTIGYFVLKMPWYGKTHTNGSFSEE